MSETKTHFVADVETLTCKRFTLNVPMVVTKVDNSRPTVY